MKSYLYLALLMILGISISTTSCKKEVEGCTNSLSTNYNPDATIDDGSCIILGCTNPSASNYNPDATEDDGNCVIVGCTEPESDNFNPEATEDDGTCIPWSAKFVGNYEVTLACENPLLALALNTPFDMEVIAKDNITIELHTTLLDTLQLVADIIEDRATFQPYIKDSILVNNVWVRDILINGEGILDDDSNLPGTFSIHLSSDVTGILDEDCPMMAVRI